MSAPRRHLWFETPKAKVLHPTFDCAANWPLRGLFWLAKDIFEDEFKRATEPDAQALYELRNHLEQQFVAVHDDMLIAAALRPLAAPPPGVFPITASDLASRTLRQLKLAGEALTYLAMGIAAEERRRKAQSGGGLTMPMTLMTWKDD